LKISLVAAWAAIVLLFAVIIGVATGWLSWLEARNVPRAVLVGGGAAGGAIALAVAVAALLV
jgi:hypothetical protein